MCKKNFKISYQLNISCTKRRRNVFDYDQSKEYISVDFLLTYLYKHYFKYLIKVD